MEFGLSQFFSTLFSHSLKPNDEKLILASQSEKVLVQNIANNINLNRHKNIEQVESLISGSFTEMVIIENEAGEFIPIVNSRRKKLCKHSKYEFEREEAFS